VERGELLKAGRGLYVVAGATLTENHSLAEAAKLSPKGVICLLSALRFHGLTTENPAEVWIAIPRGARPPKSGAPALRVARFSGRMMTEGVQRHVIQGVSVPVYCVAKTVADCSASAIASASTSPSRRCAIRGGTKRPLPKRSGITPKSAGC